jgi:hypothetical protein
MLRLRPIYVFPSVRAQMVAVSGATGVSPRVGASALVTTDVGAGGASTIVGGLVYLVAAGVEGAFSYALFTGKYIFEAKHPVWGTLFALLTMSHLYSAGNRLTAS